MMNFLSRLGSWASTFDETKLATQFGDEWAGKFSWLGDVFGPLSIVLWVMLGLAAAVGGIYSIYVGIQLARAEDQSKRDDAKKHLITVLVAVAATVLLIVFFNEIMPAILEAAILPDIQKGGTTKPGTTGATSIITTAFKMLVH